VSQPDLSRWKASRVTDQTSATIEIAARPEEIMAVIAEFADYPAWVDSITSAEVLSTEDGRAQTVQMVLDHPLVKDTYVLAYDWQPTDVRWHLVEGCFLKAMDGSYALRPKGTVTAVTYTLAVDVNLPMIGMFKRKAEKTIVDGALQGLKKRVEG
jgi:ribosome-associated toxin RatA of RatAB toxin-antitoxin module